MVFGPCAVPSGAEANEPLQKSKTRFEEGRVVEGEKSHQERVQEAKGGI